MRTAFIEGYGCSMNKNETEGIKGFLASNGFQFTEAKNADVLVINTCGVKEVTEFKMLRRTKQLMQEKKPESKLIVFGCLPRINPKILKSIPNSNELSLIGPELKKLAQELNLPEKNFSPELNELKENPFVSIISINQGCLGQCTFCGTKLARGHLKSHPIELINEKFKKCIKETKEIWLTSQDTGAYGKDTQTNLLELLKKLLQNEGKYRIRIGMGNPEHFKEFWKELTDLMKQDERIFKFLHIPFQAGSNRILKLMQREYSKEEFLELISNIKKEIPEITIATDVIVGFPSESNEEFLETMKLIQQIKPDIVNISRYGVRPGTLAAKMAEQIPGKIKRMRSKILSKICKQISLENNLKLKNNQEKAIVSEQGIKGTFMGRTNNYKPIIIQQDRRGEFIKVKIQDAYPNYLFSEIIEE